MKILHLFTGTGIYVKAAIEFFSSYTWDDNHVFYIYLNKDEKQLENQRTEVKTQIQIEYKNNISNMWKDVMKANRQYDYIVYHQFPRDVKLHMYYTFFPAYIKKIIWVIWGTDLYDWRGNKQVVDRWRTYIRKKIPYVIANEMDEKSYIKQFGKPKIFCGLYSISEDPGYDIKTIEKNRVDKPGKSCNILIGHSATEKLNHIEILDRLKKYKDEDICLTIPLNYGRTDYANKVSQYAIDIFGNDKVKIITDKMSLNDYMSLLWTCDSAIFHSDRQIALGNMFMLLYMKKKIFLKEGSVLKNYYDQKGLITYDSNRIDEMNYVDFVTVQEDLEPNKQFAIMCIDRDQRYRTWVDLLARI